MGIQIHHARFPHQGRDQHHQGRFGQVEVGHERICDFEGEAGVNENVRIPFPCCDFTSLARGRFDQPKRCCANGKAALVPAMSWAVSSDTRPHSECILWVVTSSTFTGRNVPAPT